MPRTTVFRLELAVHAAFFLVVIGSFGRLLTLNARLCVWVLGLSLLLSAGYSVAVWRGERLGRLQAPVIAAVVLIWMVLIATVPTPYAAVYSWIAIPLACLWMRALPARWSLVAVGIVTGLLGVALWRQYGNLELFLPPTAAVWATVALYAGQQRDKTLLQDLVVELERTRSELAEQQREAGVLAERARLAGDLHDTVTQELAGSRMLLQAADRDWDTAPAKARRHVRAVSEMLGQSVVQARRLIADLGPAELDGGDLQAALEELCRREQQYGHAVVLRATGQPVAASPEVERALLRTAQGALANVRDHAGADHVEVLLDWQHESVRLRISDDGGGVRERESSPDRGFGLPSLRERLRVLGGTLTLDSTPGRGAALTVSVPVAAVTG